MSRTHNVAVGCARALAICGVNVHAAAVLMFFRGDGVCASLARLRHDDAARRESVRKKSKKKNMTSPKRRRRTPVVACKHERRYCMSAKDEEKKTFYKKYVVTKWVLRRTASTNLRRRTVRARDSRGGRGARRGVKRLSAETRAARSIILLCACRTSAGDIATRDVRRHTRTRRSSGKSARRRDLVEIIVWRSPCPPPPTDLAAKLDRRGTAVVVVNLATRFPGKNRDAKRQHFGGGAAGRCLRAFRRVAGRRDSRPAITDASCSSAAAQVPLPVVHPRQSLRTCVAHCSPSTRWCLWHFPPAAMAGTGARV